MEVGPPLGRERFLVQDRPRRSGHGFIWFPLTMQLFVPRLNNFKYTLAEITYLLNFSDQSHFSNSFKEMYGVTPNKFRNSIKKKKMRL